MHCLLTNFVPISSTSYTDPEDVELQTEMNISDGKL